MASALARAHIDAGERLRTYAAEAVGAAWQRLPGYDESDVDAFLAAAVPVVAAAQRQSVIVTDAYLARSLRRQNLGIDPAVVLAAVRGATGPQEVYRRPFVTVWTALAAGKAFEDAIAAGLAHATSSARMDVQLAMRQTMQTAQDRIPEIRGYRRVADPGACDYCSAIDGAFVKSADAMPLHNGCGCGLEPITDPVAATPVPDDVAVHSHGELGPVLGSADHNFTRL